MFLIKNSCTDYSVGERSWCNENEELAAPEGYIWVCAAKKKDIHLLTKRKRLPSEAIIYGDSFLDITDLNQLPICLIFSFHHLFFCAFLCDSICDADCRPIMPTPLQMQFLYPHRLSAIMLQSGLKGNNHANSTFGTF